MGGGQVLGDRSEVAEEALVGEQETGAEVLVQTEGMLQTVVSYQECPALWDQKEQREEAIDYLSL